MKLEVDLGKCYKSGECCYNHPDLFKVGDEGFPQILVTELTTDPEKLEAEQAVEVCPAQAISIID
jgi:ferredoxin